MKKENISIARSYCVGIAEMTSIAEAVVLEGIRFWVDSDTAQQNGRNYHDGHYWTSCVNEAFCQLFPELSSEELETTLKSLESRDLIVISNLDPYNRSRAYALTDVAYNLLHGKD